MKRIFVLICVVIAGISIMVLPSKAETQEEIESKYQWFSTEKMNREGQGWSKTVLPYDRLPAKAWSMVREEVWELAQHSAGIVIPFTTDSRTIAVKWRVCFDFKLTHMTGSGIRGVDLYARDSVIHQWRWVGTGRPDYTKTLSVLSKNMTASQRHYRLYLPLYDGIDSLWIGIDSNRTIQSEPDQDDSPLVFYGTSITQGCSASRPGMAYPAIIGRKLERETINLGFSGNGRMDMELADLIGELKTDMIILDCLPNLTPEQLIHNVQPFVARLCQFHPLTPILLVESVLFPAIWIDTSLSHSITTKNSLLKHEYQQLLTKGYKNIYYLEGNDLIGRDGETTVDGTHLTDIGMQRIADKMTAKITEILNSQSPTGK